MIPNDITRCHGRINEHDCNEREQCQRWLALQQPSPHVMRISQEAGMKSSLSDVCASRIAPWADSAVNDGGLVVQILEGGNNDEA